MFTRGTRFFAEGIPSGLDRRISRRDPFGATTLPLLFIYPPWFSETECKSSRLIDYLKKITEKMVP